MVGSIKNIPVADAPNTVAPIVVDEAKVDEATNNDEVDT